MSRNLDTVINEPLRKSKRVITLKKTLQRQRHNIKSSTLCSMLIKRQELYCQMLQH